MDEIEERFGKGNPRRKEMFERLRMFVDLAQHCGVLRMFVNGSFVTAKPEPGDVDVVIWLRERFRKLLLRRNWRALILKQIFIKRKPQEAFLVVNQMKWDRWLEFFYYYKKTRNGAKA